MLTRLKKEKLSERKFATIRYLRAMIKELATMAADERLELSMYFLEMAHAELGEQLRKEHAKRRAEIVTRSGLTPF